MEAGYNGLFIHPSSPTPSNERLHVWSGPEVDMGHLNVAKGSYRYHRQEADGRLHVLALPQGGAPIHNRQFGYVAPRVPP